MPDLPKIIEDKENTRSSSEINEKQKDLLEELSNLLDKIGKNYGPFLMKELIKRMEIVVENFNQELTTLINGSFKKRKIKESKLRDLLASDIKVIKEGGNKLIKGASKAPDFIKDVKFGPIRPNK